MLIKKAGKYRKQDKIKPTSKWNKAKYLFVSYPKESQALRTLWHFSLIWAGRGVVYAEAILVVEHKEDKRKLERTDVAQGVPAMLAHVQPKVLDSGRLLPASRCTLLWEGPELPAVGPEALSHPPSPGSLLPLLQGTCPSPLAFRAGGGAQMKY